MADATVRYNVLSYLSGKPNGAFRGEIASNVPGGTTAADEELSAMVEEGLLAQREDEHRGAGDELYYVADQEAADKFNDEYNESNELGESPTMGQASLA